MLTAGIFHADFAMLCHAKQLSWAKQDVLSIGDRCSHALHCNELTADLVPMGKIDIWPKGPYI